MPWAIDTKNGRLFSSTTVQYVAQFFFSVCLAIREKIARVKKMRESIAFLTS